MTIENFSDGELLSSVRNKLNANDEELDQRLTSVEDYIAAVVPPTSLEDMQLIHFDTAPDSTPTTPGSMYWDNSDNAKTLSIVMDSTEGTTLQVGQENYYRVKASEAISDGQVVMYTGAQGNSGLMLAAPAEDLLAGENDLILGVATENIAQNATGYITTFGLVRGINTTGSAQGETWVDGDALFYNPLIVGGLTKVKPTAPNPFVTIGNVINANSSGSIMVRVHHGSTFGYDDGNAQITNPQGNDFVVYNQTNSRWENYTPSSARTALGLGSLALQSKQSFVVSPQANATPVTNGDAVLELTNNTTLTIKVKGSDGVVRSTTLTLV